MSFPEVIQERKYFPVNLDKLKTVKRLESGSHSDFNDGQMCVMEAIAWVTNTENITDHPICADSGLTEFAISLNDSIVNRVVGSNVYGEDIYDTSGDDLRTKHLLPVIPDLIGTRIAFTNFMKGPDGKRVMGYDLTEFPWTEEMHHLVKTFYAAKFDTIEDRFIAGTEVLKKLCLMQHVQVEKWEKEQDTAYRKRNFTKKTELMMRDLINSIIKKNETPVAETVAEVVVEETVKI